MKKLFLVLIIALSYGVANAAYNPIPSNYKSQYNPAEWASGSKTIGLDVQSPGSTFRVFVPGGATKVSLITYTERDARLGVMSRFGMAPECSYNTSKMESEYYALPWNDNQGVGISKLGKDYQCRNWGGYSRILDVSYNKLKPESAGWIYVKGVPYDGAGTIRSMAFYVTVDVDDYKSWYDGASWSGGNPGGASGISGGYCDPLWAQAGTGGNGDDPVVPPDDDQEFTEFECIFFKGGQWVDGECVLPGMPPEPEPVLPKTIVFQFKSGVVMTFTFKPEGVLTITAGEASLNWEYEDTEDETIIKEK